MTAHGWSGYLQNFLLSERGGDCRSASKDLREAYLHKHRVKKNFPPISRGFLIHLQFRPQRSSAQISSTCGHELP
jgi:hypothetical protein